MFCAFNIFSVVGGPGGEGWNYDGGEQQGSNQAQRLYVAR